MATVAALLTIEEYAALPDDGRRTELVEGRIIELTQPGFDHGKVCVEMAFQLKLIVKQQGSGQVVGNDTGVIIRRNPDTLRGADVAYYSATRMPAGRQPGYAEQPPDLVVEVRSPSDSWREMLAKAAEYLGAGVLVVVLLDGKTDSAYVVSADEAPQMLGPDEMLTFPDLLPEFRVRVGAIFEG